MNQTEINFNGTKITGYWRDQADKSVWTEIFKLREYRQAEEIIKESKKIILDIGAHAGFFALYCRALNSKTPIICVEPEPENIKILNRHLEINDTHGVMVEPSALAEKSGKRELFISPDSSFHFLLSDGEKTDSKIIVNCLSLKDLRKKYKIDRIDIMKMDIEGGEYELIQHWSKDEWSAIDNLIMEYHDYRNNKHKILKQILNENGFSVEEYPSKFDNTMGFFFARNKKINK